MQQQLFKVAALLLFCVNVMCSDQKDALRSHLQKLIQFPCGNPQPRVIELEELLDEDRMKQIDEYREMIYPHVTVLNRCSCTGYCENKNHSCVALESENITLTFGIFGDVSEYFEVNTVNHTKCICDIMQ